MAPKKVAKFKQQDEAVSVEELEEEPAAVGGGPQVADDPGQLTLQDLAEMFRKNMEVQQRQEVKMEREAARQGATLENNATSIQPSEGGSGFSYHP